MIVKEDIIKQADYKIRQLGGYLVDVKLGPNNTINIYIDKTEGISFNDCLEISKYIERLNDREKEDYELNVFSPGLESPFKVDQQYYKNIGKEVGVLLQNGKRKKGILKSYDKKLILEIKKKKKGSRKTYIKEFLKINKEEIKETKLKLNFK